MKRSGKAALAVVLTAGILLLTGASASASIHQRLHQDGCGMGDGCVLCMMIQGQVDFQTPAPIQDCFVSEFLGLTPTLVSGGIHQVDWRLSPSRAPPTA
jgi:hypothetical protein